MNQVQEQIDDLVKSNDVVLFMKGSAAFPQYRFSSSAIQILKASGADLRTIKFVNVLDNHAIHQGVKEYSNWPSIPVLYVRGELVGGPDILTEIYRSGELKQFLAKPTDGPPRSSQVGAALAEIVKPSLRETEIYDDARFNISVDASTFVSELTAFSLSAVQAAIRHHGTSNDLLSGFEGQISQDFSRAINELYIQRSPQFLKAFEENEGDSVNLKTQGDILSVFLTSDTISQLLIGQVLNTYWDNIWLGTVTLLKKTGFFHG